MKTVQIFFNRIRDQIRLEWFTVSESEYSTSDTVSISEYLNCIFMMSISNFILSDMVDIIFIPIQINKYNINDIYLYLIYFHLYLLANPELTS
jgi:hypothetical protein